uniref:F-box domain-containing protein n=1 Tax=Aegilops tauschii subsp. strangulata TaxID=200361 RepID=A0A453G2J6_AEGTS
RLESGEEIVRPPAACGVVVTLATPAVDREARKMQTTVEDLPADVLACALRRLDGPSLAAASCATAGLRARLSAAPLRRRLPLPVQFHGCCFRHRGRSMSPRRAHLRRGRVPQGSAPLLPGRGDLHVVLVVPDLAVPRGRRRVQGPGAGGLVLSVGFGAQLDRRGPPKRPGGERVEPAGGGRG